MHHLPGEEGPVRATRHQSRMSEYVVERVAGETPEDFQEYHIPNRDLRESEWETYPAQVRKAVRDSGLWTVKTDAEMKAPAEAVVVEEAPAPARTAKRSQSEGEK